MANVRDFLLRNAASRAEACALESSMRGGYETLPIGSIGGVGCAITVVPTNDYRDEVRGCVWGKDRKHAHKRLLVWLHRRGVKLRNPGRKRG